MQQDKNKKRQAKFNKEKDELRAKLKSARIQMRKQRKARNDAKLKKHGNRFVKAQKKVFALKDKIHATKINLGKVVHSLHKAQVKIIRSKLKLQKATGKKVKTIHRKPHDVGRLQAQMRITLEIRNKLFSLQNRLARSKVLMDYAQTQKGQKAGALELHLTKRIDRLSKRVVRKQKDLMRVLKRKHRTRPGFKAIYKKMAKKAYKLAKADTPKEMTNKDKVHVLNLKKKVEKLMQKHLKLVGKKQKVRTAISRAKVEVKARKDVKKADKKAAGGKIKKTTSKKQNAKAKKEAATKAFKLHIAKLKRKSAKEHRHNLRQQDRKVMGEVKTMNKEILRVSGQHNQRTSLLAQKPRVQIMKLQKRLEKKVKRAEKAIEKEDKKMKKSKAAKDSKNIAKHSLKLTHQKILLMKRKARLASFKKKKLKNPKVKADAKLKKKMKAKKDKYKK